MTEEQGIGNIGDFLVDVQVVFDFDAQLAAINEQLRAFASRIAPIEVPIRFVGVNQESLEISAMGASAPLSAIRRAGLTESQWEAQSTRSMRGMGYRQGEGGWYMPEEGAGASSAGAARSAGAFGGAGDMLGFAGSFAAFTGAFAVVGDLLKGAQLDRQLAVLQALIPTQQQYTETIQQLQQTANLTGIDIGTATHSFVSFANAAKNSNIAIDQASESFKALSIAISATGSQQQSYRIIGDFIHLLMNTPANQVSMAQVQRTDLGRYLDIPKLLENLPQFHNITDLKQLTDEFDKLSKAEQLAAINTALLTAYQNQAAAAQNTLAGEWTIFQNDLEIFGAMMANTLTPALKGLIGGLDVLITFIEAIANSADSAAQSVSNRISSSHIAQEASNILGGKDYGQSLKNATDSDSITSAIEKGFSNVKIFITTMNGQYIGTGQVMTSATQPNIQTNIAAQRSR